MNKTLIIAALILLVSVFPTEQRNSKAHQKRSDQDIARRQLEHEAWKRAHIARARSLEPTEQRRDHVDQPAVREIAEPQPEKREQQTEPAKREQEPEPAKRGEKPEPAKREQEPEPAKREQQPEPAKREQQPEPAKREQEPDPVKREKDPKKRDFDFHYRASEDQIVADLVKQITDKADACDKDVMCTNKELAADLEVLLNDAKAKYGSEIVDKAVEAANDPNYAPPADKTAEVNALLEKLGNAATTNSNVFKVLELVLDVYADFAKKSYDLDVQIAQANEDISVNQALIDSRDKQIADLNKEISELKDESRNMGCDDL